MSTATKGRQADRDAHKSKPLDSFIHGPQPIPEEAPIPIRILRQQAILAGVRITPLSTREELIAGMKSLGEFPFKPRPIAPALSIKTRAHSHGGSVAVSCGGMTFEVDENGVLWINDRRSSESFECALNALDMLIQTADTMFDEWYETDQTTEKARLAYIDSVKEYDGAPVPPTPDQQRIIKLADAIGVRNCDLTMAMIAVLQAYGKPIGEKVEDADGSSSHVMFTPEEMETHCIKAMEVPL